MTTTADVEQAIDAVGATAERVIDHWKERALLAERALDAVVEIARADVPALLLSGLRRYCDDRIPPGGFLRAVLENDLIAAVTRGTPESIAALPAIVAWLIQHAPALCCGSADNVAAWLAERPRPRCLMHVHPGGQSNERCARDLGHPGPCGGGK